MTELVVIRGVAVNDRTQCAHYHSDRDIIAVRFKCCGTFYACIHCHDKLAGHAAVVWPKEERETAALFCGNCHKIFSITDYLSCEDFCPQCGAAFNPRCNQHYHFYFEL